MRFKIYTFILFFSCLTTLVVGQTPPSVSDTIDLNFDTIALPKRGPNFDKYYGSGQKLFATTPVYYEGIKVYESNDFGTTWRVKFDKVVDFNAHDSVIIYSQYVYGRPISANVFTGNDGAYKIFASTDGGNSFALRDSNYVESISATRFSCVDSYTKLQRLNDSVLVYGIEKYCNIYHPTGLFGSPYARTSIDNGRNWSYNDYDRIPDFIINGTAFRRRDSFLLFTQRADFQYIDSLKLLPVLMEMGDYEPNGRSFIAGVFSFIFTNGNSNNSIVYATRNRGQTWEIDTIDVQLQLYAKNQIIQVKDTIFLMGKYGLNRADNGNFHNLRRIYPQFNNNSTNNFSFSIASSGIYINGVDKALFRSKNGGNSWEIRNNTEGSNGDSNLYAFGDDMWFYDKKFSATYHFEGANPVGRLDTFAQVVPNFTLYAKGFRKDSLYLIGGIGHQIRSFDKGFTWQNLSVEQFEAKSDSNTIYGIGRYNSVVVSVDNGNNFSRFFMPDSTESVVDVLIKKDIVWATVGNSDNGSRIIRSTDRGQTWANVFKRADIAPVWLVMEGQALWMYASSQRNFTDGQVFKSTDDGITWTQLSSDVSRVCDGITRKKGYLFLHGQSSDRYWFFISKNDGITWTRVNNVPNALITDKYIYTSTTPATLANSTSLKIARYPIDSLFDKLKSAKTYSLLRGQILKDKNANCQQDATDAPFMSKMLRFNGGFNTSTDQNGRFSIMLPVDTYKIEVANERYFALRCGSDTASKRLIVRPNLTTDTTLFFQKTTIAHDIYLSLTANGRPRPASELEFVVNLKNLGTEIEDSVRVQFDFSNLPVRFVSASPNAVQNGQKLTWLRRNFPIDAEELLKITVRIDTTGPLSTILNFYAQADILNKMDTFPSNNRDSARLTIVGSYDPNDKTVLPDGNIPLSASLNAFDYIIRFQNTGTDTAYKVVVVDTLPDLLDVHSLIIKSASHKHQLRVDKNVLIFTFDRIMLPDSFVNERASHGFMRFSIMPKKRLLKGEILKNSAQIFFDYNAAILTNTAQNNVYKPSILTQKTVILCEGDRWQGVVYTRPTVKIDTIQTALTDTINTTFLDVKPKYYRQIDTTLRYGDTLFGQRLESNQKFTFERRTVFGCDSTTVYNVVVLRPNQTADVDVSKIKITLSPNPVNNWLSINYDLNTGLETEIYWVNSLGQKMGIIKQKAFDTEGSHSVRLDTRNFAVGAYQIILQTPKGIKAVIFSKI
jgi:photosystem II stability/assembly factor-like uncharacterized protein